MRGTHRYVWNTQAHEAVPGMGGYTSSRGRGLQCTKTTQTGVTIGKEDAYQLTSAERFECSITGGPAMRAADQKASISAENACVGGSPSQRAGGTIGVSARPTEGASGGWRAM
jgi:hypothetical protein